MTHTTLQKYTQHITSSKDNHSERTKFYYKNTAHILTFPPRPTGNLSKYSQLVSSANRTSFD